MGTIPCCGDTKPEHVAQFKATDAHDEYVESRPVAIDGLGMRLSVQNAEELIKSKTEDPIDCRLSRALMLKDQRSGKPCFQQLGPFQLADNSKHEWRPKMFENSAKKANLCPDNATGYSTTNEVKWWVKIKSGYVPDCLLQPICVFKESSMVDIDGDPAFVLLESPQYPVTLEADAKAICNIPGEADQFSFVYPVGNGILDDKKVEEASNGADGEQVKANIGLLQVGAFAYWKGASAFPALALRPLELAEVGLTFSLPRDLELVDGGNMQNLLSWHDVTLPFLKNLGVKAFTWINPCRPDILPQLNYYSVRADEDLFLPDPIPFIGLINMHKIERTTTAYWLQGRSRPENLQVSDSKGTRAKPEILHALSQYNLRDRRNGHRYQFAENGAFAYKMTDGSVRYFDVVDTFLRPAAINLEAQTKLQKNPKYKEVCNSLLDCVDKCSGLQIGTVRKSEWNVTASQWSALSRGLTEVQRYEAMLTEHYNKEHDQFSKLDAMQITKLGNARRDDLMTLTRLLDPKPPTRMTALGPIALLNNNWKADDFNLDFNGTSQKDLQSRTPEEAVKKFKEFVSLYKEVAVQISSVPSSLTLQELGYNSTMQLQNPLKTQMSLVSPITLPVLSKHRAGVPLSATHFAFLYPANDSRVNQAEGSNSFRTAKHDRELSLLLLGGFIYLNERGQIVENGIKTLKFGLSDGLRFSEVRDFDAFVEASLGLAKAKRASNENPILALESNQWWHQITAAALSSMQVSHFTWLPPCPAGQESPVPGLVSDGVPLADHNNGKPYVLGEHGSFMYKGTKDAYGKERIIYFDVLPDPMAALYTQLEEWEQFKCLTDMIDLMKKRLLDFEVDNNSIKDIQTQPLVASIAKEQQKSPSAVARMLADYIRAISDLQVDHCIVCTETYSSEKPRRVFGVCKHTVCSHCEPKLRVCPQCNKSNLKYGPKLDAEPWLQLIDEPEKLAAIIQNTDINMAHLWWRKNTE